MVAVPMVCTFFDLIQLFDDRLIRISCLDQKLSKAVFVTGNGNALQDKHLICRFWMTETCCMNRYTIDIVRHTMKTEYAH